MGDKQSLGVNPDRAGGSEPADQACQGSQKEAKKIQIGMVVEADQGDLGQEDISEAKVTDVIHDQAGDVETIVVEKGTVFRKQLKIPVERIQSVGPGAGGVESDGSPNKVIFSASEKEVETLTATGSEAFPPEALNSPKCEDDLLDLTGKTLPTDVGLRRLEEEELHADLTGRPVSWSEALEALADFNKKSGGSFWRLPNINELESLVDCSRHGPALPAGQPFHHVQDGYWSSTTSMFEPDWAWALYLAKGAVGVGQKRGAHFSVWAVGEHSQFLKA